MSSKRSPSSLSWIATVTLLLAFFAQLALGSRELSLTSDEPAHLAGGYTYLVAGATWPVPSRGQPPLVNAWSALPVVLGNPRVPVRDLPNWDAGVMPPYIRSLLPRLGPVESVEVAGRVPVMLLAMVLAALVFRWSADLWGGAAGVFALALLVFDPLMVAHSQLSTTDLGVTLFGFATFFIAWRFATHGRLNPRAMIILGLVCGAAMTAKLSGLMWVGLALMSMAVVALIRARRAGDSRQVLLRAAGGLLLSFVIALGFVWAIYLFRVGPLDIGPFQLPVPAPRHWEGLLRQWSSTSSRLMYLMGETRLGDGWWWYFPLAFLVKNPIPLILLTVGSLPLVLRSLRHREIRWTDTLFLLLFPIVYVAIAIKSEFNIGYRHMLPIHPFLYVLAGQWVPLGRCRRIVDDGWASRLYLGGCLTLILWQAVGTLVIFPHSLAYFNELVGGPRQGYRYLVDSNLDWGQGFKALRDELARTEALPPVRIAHTWYAGPELYGVEYEPLPPFGDDFSISFSPRFDPPPGTYVLGATILYRGSGYLEQYEWFRHQRPISQPGYGLFVFRVEPDNPEEAWLAQCLRPAPPLGESLITQEFQSVPKRHIHFDCTQGWIYPGDSESNGWYALHNLATADQGNATRAFVASHLNRASLVYEHAKNNAMAPAFRLYRAMGSDVPGADIVWLADAQQAPATVVGHSAYTASQIRSAGPLRFLGYREWAADSQRYHLETWWLVIEASTRPVSIMGHLVHADGQPAGVADGLAVPVESWQPGDILVQHHTFSSEEESEDTSFWLRTGTYWLDTMERHQMTTRDGETAGDHLLLPLPDGHAKGVERD